MGHGAGLAQAGICLKEFTEPCNGSSFDLANTLGKLVQFYLYQVGIGQRLPRALIPFFAHSFTIPRRQLAKHYQGLSARLLSSLELQIDICQVLVQLSPESLFSIPRIDPTLRHENQSLFPSLALVLRNLIRRSPGRRLRASFYPVLGDNPAIFKNEVAPDQPPTNVFKNPGFWSVRGIEGYEFAFFRRPVLSGLHSLK
jgi:hypothetical protein